MEVKNKKKMIKTKSLTSEEIIDSALELYQANLCSKVDVKETINSQFKEKITYNKNILDNGFIELIDYLGNDLTTVNAARVSFNKRKTKFDKKDAKLMKFLKENEHHSPFRHPQVELHIKCPEAVARQLWKHCIGANTTSQERTDSAIAWNEISRRYVEIQDFHIPNEFRKQHEKSKQSSVYDENGNPETFDDVTNYELKRDWENCIQNIQWTIEKLLENGVSKEQAQMLLPLTFYTEFYWTTSFQSLAHFCDLRHHHDACDAERHSQWEIAQYASSVYDILYLLFPKTSEMWFNN